MECNGVGACWGTPSRLGKGTGVRYVSGANEVGKAGMGGSFWGRYLVFGDDTWLYFGETGFLLVF